MVKEHRLSIRRACSAIRMARSLFYYEHQREDDSTIIDAIHTVPDKHPRYGFRAIFERLKRKEYGWNGNPPLNPFFPKVENSHILLRRSFS